MVVDAPDDDLLASLLSDNFQDSLDRMINSVNKEDN